MATNRLVIKEEIKVYASMMFDVANQESGEEGVVAVRMQMEEICKALNANMDLYMGLTGDDYSPAQRGEIARGVFAECEPALTETLAVMAERGDIPLLPRVYETYNELLGSKMGLAVVDVTTVVPLDDELRQLIVNKVQADLGKRAVLRESIDKSILGGIIMSVDGKHIDASMNSQLNRARTVLKDNTDGGEC